MYIVYASTFLFPSIDNTNVTDVRYLRWLRIRDDVIDPDDADFLTDVYMEYGVKNAFGILVNSEKNIFPNLLIVTQ